MWGGLCVCVHVILNLHDEGVAKKDSSSGFQSCAFRDCSVIFQALYQLRTGTETEADLGMLDATVRSQDRFCKETDWMWDVQRREAHRPADASATETARTAKGCHNLN